MNNNTTTTRSWAFEPEEDDVILSVESWEDIMIEVVLDSGACRHVMTREGAPGHQVHESSASRRGFGFVVGNGERIPNEGQFVFHLDADNGQGSAPTACVHIPSGRPHKTLDKRLTPS